ncbi:hypothetical protein HN011_009186 [Eciton burchellii]|nr:hypothetical protein HN011_009186 [Eciton burchellii]
MVQQEAVIVRNAVKTYGKTPVLKGLNMTVSKGTIYGLLGASGCGKTTILTCIVGVRNLSNGQIWVLGGNPGNKDSGIPGPRVGYMPQEISLIGEFTVTNALYYFGTINGLQNDEIETRKDFLMKLLQLPSDDRLVKNMSGGQQRRVSLAAAMIHKPELLILDEPTVGLDPILREKIWAHFVKITREENVTILITTHYIDEAKDADKIGLMRCGKLLTESSPQQLLEQFQCSSLEEAFLTLSQTQSDTDISTKQTFKRETESSVSYQNDYYQVEDETLECNANPDLRRIRRISQLRKFKALMIKNSIQFLRHYTGIAFALLFPIAQITTFFIGIGRDPKNLAIGIINDEAGNCDHGNNFGNILYDEETFICNFGNLTCRFLYNLGNSIATQKYYNDISEATTAVHDGTLVGIIHFHQNFSEALKRRLEDSFYAEENDLIASQIQISLDMSDVHISTYIQKRLFDRFLEIFENIMTECRISSKIINSPLRFENPLYGTKDPNYLNFMAPAYIITVIFFLAITISSTIIMTDRKEGLWNRSLVQGVKPWEILLTHILTQIAIIIIHNIVIISLCFPVWGLQCKGSLFIVILFTFLIALCGMMYGFMLSITCTNHMMAYFATTGSFFPLIFLGGCLWPVDGMPKVLRWISLVLPMTIPAISLRNVFVKAYSLYQPQVYHEVYSVYSKSAHHWIGNCLSSNEFSYVEVIASSNAMETLRDE